MVRRLCRTDLFFLLWFGLGRKDIARQFLLDRCKEVQENPNGFIDLWSREHYKSTIITIAKSMQDVLASHGDDPLPEWGGREVTIGIFSHSRPIAKGFLDLIKREFESNELLKSHFPDVLYDNPSSQAPKWSLDSGIIVKRKSNPVESTIEAWGLVDGMPTSRHFFIIDYDDVVTEQSVTTPEMIEKTTKALELSYNLGAAGGVRRMVGTRYHYNDSYREVMARGTFKPRIYAGTDDGTIDGTPLLLTREELMKKRKDLGPYTFSCHGQGTKILMADWTERNIEIVRPGDMVVGWEMKKGRRSKLVPTKVTAIHTNVSEAQVLEMESGRWTVCTPDHKWFTGRRGTDGHKTYAAAGFGYGQTQALASLYDPSLFASSHDMYWSGYLAGLFDGEGSVSPKGTLHISQSYGVNPHICERIRKALSECGFTWSEYRPTSRPEHIDFCITGGRQETMRFLSLCRPAKSKRIIHNLFTQGTRNFGKGARDKITKVIPVGRLNVYNIQTETGNYVANGYCSKNCQILQNPVAENTQGFEREWLRTWDIATGKMLDHTTYILVDAASEKRKTNDYTVMWVVKLGHDGKARIVDIVRDRLNLTERAAKLMALHRKWYNPGKFLEVRYEKYGMMGDIEHIKTVQDAENYQFDVVEVGGATPKNDRIRRLIPWFEQGRILLPDAFIYKDYEGINRNLTNIFIEEEYVPFPVLLHDDMLDSLARLAEPDKPLIWPVQRPENDRARDRYAEKGARKIVGWMGR